MKIHDVFPTGIGTSNIDLIPTEEHEYLLNLKYHNHNMYDMIVTEDKYVLNNGIPIIKQFIEQQLEEFSPKILGTNQKLKILQSWCTKHDSIPQKTFAHTHQNSIISGVYYISATEENEGITFYRPNEYNDKYVTWKTETDLVEKYPWNWQWAKFPVSTGLLILFPSQIKHAVIGTLSPNLRCSLAFNTWFDGPIGDEYGFSRL